MSINRVHIASVGPRTGSTLLFEVIKTCFSFNGYCEHEASICQSSYEFASSGWVLTKDAYFVSNVRQLLSLNKNLRVIIIMRDPRDMIVSRHRGSDKKYYCDLRYWKYFVLNYKQLLNHNRIFIVKYEQLISEPNIIQAKLKSFLKGLSLQCDFVDYHINANVSSKASRAMHSVRPIPSFEKEIKWKKNKARIYRLFQEDVELIDSLIEFGYEEDRNWFDCLSLEIGLNTDVDPIHVDKLIVSNKTVWQRIYCLFIHSFEGVGLNPVPLKNLLKKLLIKSR